jgi:hypothetical protein
MKSRSTWLYLLLAFFMMAAFSIFASKASAQTIVGERSVSAMYSNAGSFELNIPDGSFDYDRSIDTFAVAANVPVAEWADVGGIYSYSDGAFDLPLFPSVVDIDYTSKVQTISVFGSFYFPRTYSPVVGSPAYTERNLFTPYITVGIGHAFGKDTVTVRDLWYDDTDPFRASDSYSSWVGFEQIGVVIGNDYFQINPYFRYNFVEGTQNDTYYVGADADVTVGPIALFVGFARGFEQFLNDDIHSEWNEFRGGFRVLF